MKDFCQYGNRRDDEWEILPWIPDPRPPFKIWVKPEQIAPFVLRSVSVLAKVFHSVLLIRCRFVLLLHPVERRPEM